MDWVERVDELDPAQQALVAQLAIMRDLRKQMSKPNGYHYYGMQDFLLQHGEWFKPQPWVFPYAKGAPKCCYANALMLGVQQKLKYVEGVALVPNLPLEFQHGWNTNEKRELIDNTWMNTGTAYLGVEFSLGRADNATWTDDATILDNPRRRFDIYKKPWPGEDFKKKWPKTDGWKLLSQVEKLVQEACGV